MSTTWTSTQLEHLVSKVGSGATPKGGEAAYHSTGTPLIRSMNVVFFGFKRTGLAFIDEQQSQMLANAEVHAGDVLLNITGASIGRVTLAPNDLHGARVNQHVCIIRPNEAIDRRYLNAFLSSPSMQAQIAGDNYGVTRQALTKSQILGFEIPLAPLPEQQRIANKLDSVLARVDACRERLARVQPLLKRFRQSVLAAATSGALTADWRGDTEFQTQTARFEELVTDTLVGLVRSATEQYGPGDGRTPYLKMNNIGEEWGSNLTKMAYVYCTPDELDRYTLRNGDWLFNTRNSIELVGKSCVWQGDAVVFNNNILRARFKEEIAPPYIEIFFRSPLGRNNLDKIKSATTSVAAIYQKALMVQPIEFPSIEEQHEIVHHVETLFAFADRLEARLAAAQTAAERLTPALLAKAFRGKLVPQDPNDEPAAELLKRLAAARSTAPKPKRGRKGANIAES